MGASWYAYLLRRCRHARQAGARLGACRRAAVYVDDREQSVASGELEIPVAEGVITPEDIRAELGEVIAGMATGRSDDEQVTVFDTSGIAVQDLSASKIAYDRAIEAGLGTVVEL